MRHLRETPEAQNGLNPVPSLEAGFDPPQVDKTLVRILARIELRCDLSSRLRGSPVVLAAFSCL